MRRHSSRVQRLHDHLLASSPTKSGVTPPDQVPMAPKGLPSAGDDEELFNSEYFTADGGLQFGNRHLQLTAWHERTGPGGHPFSYPSFRPDALGGDPIRSEEVIVTDLADAKRLLRTHIQKEWKSQSAEIFKEGVLSQGDLAKWKEQRKRLKPAFSAKSLMKLMPMMNKEAGHLVEKLQLAADAREEVDLFALLDHSALMVMGNSLIGQQDSEWLKKNHVEFRDQIFNGNIQQLNFLKTEEGQRVNKFFHKYSDLVLNSDTPPPKGSVAEVIMREGEDSVYENNEQRHQELMVFNVAGHMTTAATMMWTMYELARHPEAMKKVQAECDAILRSTAGRELTYKDVGPKNTRYLTKVINEVLRLWPIVSQGPRRELIHDDTIKGPDGEEILLKKGTSFSVPHIIIHHDKKNWGEDAAEFNPDRSWNRAAWMPFTVPPRDCIGRNFAMLEMRTTIVNLCGRFNFQYHGKPKVGDTNLLGAEDGLKLTVEARVPAPAAAVMA